jgi:hypothetical protein
MKAMLRGFVREQLEEMMTARNGGQLEPDFRLKEAAQETRRIQDVFEQRKWSLYFEKWGCRACGKKTVSHASTGHCDRCHTRLYQRLATIKIEYDRVHPESRITEDIDHLTRRLRSAQALLGE